jgi:acetyl-CoA synthetase
MMVTTIPGVAEMKPGSAGPPLPGVSAKVVDGTGEPISSNEAGYLVVDRPWPGMPLSMVENEGWFVERNEGYPSLEGFDWVYFSEDAGTVDENGYITVLGRVDDLIDVSGHLFGTADIETAITDTEGVTEAAVVSGPEESDGRGAATVYAYVSTAEGYGEELREDVIEAVSEQVSPLAAPDIIVFTPDLPKTRSGKIMRRMLASVTRGDDLGDTSALRNPEVVGELESAIDSER